MKLLSRKYFNLIKEQTIAEFHLRDQNSAFGFLWTLLHPMFMVFILYFVFSQWAERHIENFMAYLLIGIIPWRFFTNATTMAMQVLTVKRKFVTNLNFRKESLLSSHRASLFFYLIASNGRRH